MANTAHVQVAEGVPTSVSVRDDRGAAVTELDLPAEVRLPEHIDAELRAAGWSRSADWSTADDGWVAPVVAT